MGASSQDLSRMTQVYSLSTWEVVQEKPEKEWFIYQNDTWEVLKTQENDSQSQRSASIMSVSDAGSPMSFSHQGEEVSTPGAVVSRHRPWPNPNPSAEANYGDPSKNIFLKMQKELIIRNHTRAPMKDIKFNKKLPPPDDLEIHPIDSKYLTYFVSEVPDILGSERFFPSAIATIFQLSVNQPVLRHSILAVSSWIVDNRLGRPPLYTHHHLQRLLPEIQKAITETKINPGHILSVCFLAWLALMTGDLYTAHRHLKGLVQMFIGTRRLTTLGEPYENPDPTLMFMHRMSLKIDNTLAYRNFPQVYPPINDHEVYHRQWLPHFIPGKGDIENCLAAFKLDDFMNRICHLHHQARQHRNDNDSQELEIQRRANSMLAEHTEWLSSSVIQNQIPVDAKDEEERQFLHYPPLAIQDAMFAQMVLIHASLGIHLSIVMTGKLGPYPHTRYEAAVQVCRIYAALGAQPAIQKTGQSRVLNSLWLAGLVLGNDYPAAFQWIIAALLELDHGKGYRAASKLADALKETWSKEDIDPWEVVGNTFDTSWKQVRHEYARSKEEIVNDWEWRAAIDTEEYS